MVLLYGGYLLAVVYWRRIFKFESLDEIEEDEIEEESVDEPEDDEYEEVEVEDASGGAPGEIPGGGDDGEPGDEGENSG